MRRSLAAGAIVVGMLAAAACSKSEQSAPTAQSVSEPGATATATAAPGPAQSAATPPVYPPNGQPPPPAPTVSPMTPPQVVIEPPEEANKKPSHRAAPSMAPKVPATHTASPEPAPKPAKPGYRPDDDGLHATPAPSLGVKKVAVLANNHYTCSSTEKRDNVSAFAEPRGARISIVGQGPCPGEVHDWSAQVTQQRVEVHGTHGSAAKCRCMGTGELVLRGLEPGTYDIAVNGGFDRPIATRITVLQ